MRALGQWIVDVLVIGGIVGALFAGDASPIGLVASSFAIGAAALTSGLRRVVGEARARWLVVGTLGLTSLHTAHGASQAVAPSPSAIFFAIVWVVTCTLIVGSTIAAGRSRAHLPLAGGLALGAVTVLDPWLIPIGVGVLASALTLAGMRDWASARPALTTSCAALLASRCATALAYELGCLLAPREGGLSNWSFGMESSWWLATKSVLEIATIAASVAVLRGRTVGVLALTLVAPMLAYVAQRSRAPYWTTGCLSHVHPFCELGGLIAVPALVIVLAWAAPMLRTMRRT